MGSAAVSAEHSNSTPRADTLVDVYSMLAAHCTPAYRFKGGVPALGESPAPLVRVRAHIEPKGGYGDFQNRYKYKNNGVARAH